MDDKDFLWQENLRAKNRAEERERERDFKEQAEKRKAEEREEREERRALDAIEKETRRIEERKRRDTESREHQKERDRERLNGQLIRDQNNQAIDAQSAAIKANSDVRLKKIENQHDFQRAEFDHKLDEERRERDYQDAIRHGNLRIQEYEQTRWIERFNEDALRQSDHYRKMDELRELLKHKLLDRHIAHKIEKDRMTHATNEQMRLEKFRMRLKAEGLDFSESELLDMMGGIFDKNPSFKKDFD